jgi:hypothetical protein
MVAIARQHSILARAPQRKPISKFAPIIAPFPLLAQKKIGRHSHDDKKSWLCDKDHNELTLRSIILAITHSSRFGPSAYNVDMARGWESKSVEEQQAEAALKKQPSSKNFSPLEAVRFRQLEGLRLSRQRVLQQLQNAHDSRLRQMLEQALADLDRQIEIAKTH